MRNWQLTLTIVGLLAVLVGMNYVADWRQQQAKAHAKEVEKARQAAETAAQGAKSSGKPEHGSGAKAFDLPANSGPPGAPVKLEIFVNNSNSCHEASTSLKNVQQAYGSLLRIEWRSMMDPKVAAQSDKLNIGCEAGLAINGKIECEVRRGGGKVLVSFRGPAGDKFKLPDVYAAINAALETKGKQPPAAAVAKAQL